MRKLYAFVDESGQDTRGERFYVGVLLVRGDLELVHEMRQRLERVESRMVPGVPHFRMKWSKSSTERQGRYLESATGCIERLAPFYCVGANAGRLV